MDLFTSALGLEPITIEDGEIAYQSQLALGIDNETVLARLIAETAWRADTIVVWGKRHPQPRLTAWQGDKAYTYSGLTLAPSPFSPPVLKIKHAVENVTGQCFNSVLLNYYRNERDSMGMHSDDEAELGPAPIIASVSFGATRTFILQHKRSQRRLKLELNSGSLLLMSGQTQHHWRHGINKQSRPCGPRVNLTFRYIC